MLDQTVDLSNLTTKLTVFMTEENAKRVQLHSRLFKKLLLKYAILRSETKEILDDIHVLLTDDKWLKLEVLAEQLNKSDDVLFRRCLFHFAKCMEPSVIRPSAVTVFDTNIDLLHWYRKSFRLGQDLNDAILQWDKHSTLARSTTRSEAQKAQKCLQLLHDSAPLISEQLCEHGLFWFKSTMHFRQVLSEHPIKDKHSVFQSALFSVLHAFSPERFSIVKITINQKSIDVTDLADIEPLLVEELQVLANSAKYKGDLEHDVVAMTRRFIATVTCIRMVTEKYKSAIIDVGLDGFKADKFYLVKKARNLLRKDQFSELLLFLEEHFEQEIHRHDYIANLLPFYFEKK